MSTGSTLPLDHSGRSALGLLERARELARQGQATSLDGTIERTTRGGGDKGEKREKPPSTSQEQETPPSPHLVVQSDDPEVAWRARAMWSHIRPGFPIPFLIARDDPIRDGACLSCSLPLRGGERYRCATCLKAATLVLTALSGGGAEDGERP